MMLEVQPEFFQKPVFLLTVYSVFLCLSLTLIWMNFKEGATGKKVKKHFFGFLRFLVRSSTARPKTQLGINSLENLSLVSICYLSTTTEHTFKFSKEKEKKLSTMPIISDLHIGSETRPNA